MILALNTIGSISTPRWSLLQLLQGSIAPYLQSDHKGIRKEAAISCVRMISASPYPSPQKSASALAIEDIVSRLVEMIVADPCSEVFCYKFLNGAL